MPPRHLALKLEGRTRPAHDAMGVGQDIGERRHADGLRAVGPRRGIARILSAWPLVIHALTLRVAVCAAQTDSAPPHHQTQAIKVLPGRSLMAIKRAHLLARHAAVAGLTKVNASGRRADIIATSAQPPNQPCGATR